MIRLICSRGTENQKKQNNSKADNLVKEIKVIQVNLDNTSFIIIRLCNILQVLGPVKMVNFR